MADRISKEELELISSGLSKRKANLTLTEAETKALKNNNIQLERSSKLLTDDLKSAERYLEIMKERLEVDGKLSDVIAKQNEMRSIEARLAQSKLRDSNDYINNYAEKELQLRAELLAVDQEILKIQYDQQAVSKEEATELAKTLKEKEKERKKKKKDLEDGKKKLEEQEELNKELTKEAKIRADVRDSTKNIQGSVKQFAKTFLGVTDLSESFSGQMIEAVQAQKELLELEGEAADTSGTAALLKVMKDLKQVMDDMTDPLKLSLMFLQKVAESTAGFIKNLDGAIGDFRKTTGITSTTMGDMQENMVDVQRANLRFGATLEETGAAQAALVTEMSAYTTMNKKAQKQVLKTSVLLQEFGVSADTTAQIFDLFTKGMGYTSDELEDLSLSLMSTADALGMPPQVIFSEFAAASTELAKYGEDMEGVFKDLAEQSKNTGIAIGDLIGMTKQFDTFQAAGESVGKLNAILGGPYLNAINMVYMTEAQRVKALRESVRASGRQFDDLERHEKQAIATAAGISDMSKAAKLFGGTNKEFAENAKSMKDLQEKAAKAQKVSEKFSQAMMALAIAAAPLVDIFAFFADVLIIMMNPLGEINRLIGGPEGLTTFLGAATIAAMSIAAAMKIYTIVIGKAAVANLAFGKTMVFAFGAIMAGAATFAAMYVILEKIEDWAGAGAKIVVGAIMAITAAVIAFRISIGDLTAIGSLALIGVAAAGIAGVATGIAAYDDGKLAGQEVPDGVGLLAEKGPEKMKTKNGQEYMVNSPSVVPLGRDDEVTSRQDTAAAAGGAGGGGLEQTVASLAAVVADLKSAVTSANESLGETQTPVQVVMNEKVVGEASLKAVKGALRLGR
tara:strand:+ start:2771 stop:5320 length:2550 start_codon:yes stop_codon:yes gene_type:complete